MAEQLAVEVDVKNIKEFDVKNVKEHTAAAGASGQALVFDLDTLNTLKDS